MSKIKEAFLKIKKDIEKVNKKIEDRVVEEKVIKKQIIGLEKKIDVDKEKKKQTENMEKELNVLKKENQKQTETTNNLKEENKKIQDENKKILVELEKIKQELNKKEITIDEDKIYENLETLEKHFNKRLSEMETDIEKGLSEIAQPLIITLKKLEKQNKKPGILDKIASKLSDEE